MSSTETLLPAAPPPPKPVFRDLPCKLTTDERERTAQALAQALDDRELVEEQKRETASQHKAQLEVLDARIGALKKRVISGEEVRPVPCHVVDDDRRYVVEWFRSDTGELVDSRPMTAEERNRILHPTLPKVALEPAPAPADETQDEKPADEDVRDAPPEVRETAATAAKAQMPASSATLFADPWDGPEDSTPPAPRKRGRPRKETSTNGPEE